jgi:hypothetical protein
MITYFKFFPTKYVQILNGSKGQIEACKVDVNGTKSYLIHGEWWAEGFLQKPCICGVLNTVTGVNMRPEKCNPPTEWEKNNDRD